MTSEMNNIMPGGRRTAWTMRRGFTLIELLVVIALSSILLILVFKPLIDSFNLTSRAGTQIESQTAARTLLREISTDLSNAEFIYDNDTPQSAINLWLFKQGGTTPYLTQAQFGMVEFVAPARQLDQALNPNLPTDPTTGQPVYPATLPAGQSGYALPVTPGRMITRYFIGLHDNTSGPDTSGAGTSGMPVRSDEKTYHGYANRWADPANTSEDNRFTIYKAQFSAYIVDPGGSKKYIPNLELFHTTTGDRTGNPILDDPNFFYDDTRAGDQNPGGKEWAVPGWKDLNGDGKVEIGENWRAIASSMLQTQKADAIALDRDDNGNVVYTDQLPTVRLLARFAPSYVENDPGSPSSLEATSAETPFTAAAGFTMQHGAWAYPYRVLVYRGKTPDTDPLTQNPLTYYEYWIDPTTRQAKIVAETVNQNAKPTPEAGLPDVGPKIDPNTGFFTNPNAEYAFSVDYGRGDINFAFPQWVTVNDGTNQLPQKYDPAAINNGMTSIYAERYLSLDAVLPLMDSNNNPLNPASAVSPLYRFYPRVFQPNGDQIYPAVQVVPGSERVFGPDQQPGPHYGYRIQYTRVPSSISAAGIGPNQYRINYQVAANSQNFSNANDPSIQAGFIEFDKNFDQLNEPNIPLAAEDPHPYDPNTHPTKPNYRPHSLPQLKYDPASDTNVPADPIEVAYQFQMNQPSDVVKADYLTRELIEVGIQTRLYDTATATAQSTDLTEKIKVRNLQR